AIKSYYELLKLINNDSVYLEEYARTMIGQEELHVLEVEKMLKSN
ncbi:MAG: bacterioferritin, partial [Candidatus Marinimicrobia bacterium]|nr:bacterioferritin [Candidatus Neomarinimicrobiota bacterium]MDG2367158.1 bacterioferritin [Candidatus Neomarinimicrobiota bacterium]